jgi:hypothetical protein
MNELRWNKLQLALRIHGLLAACIGGSFTLHAQTTQATSPSAAVYRVAGTVVSAADGHVLAHARVLLTSTKNPALKDTSITSDDGHFEFTKVPAGKYSLEAAKRGFISQSLNQHEQFSTAVVTAADLPTDNLLLRLPPSARLSVKIFDESSEPVRNATIMIYIEDRSSGVRRLVAHNSAQTNDLGACEFNPLTPATYFVSAIATPWYAIHPSSLTHDPQSAPLSDMRPFDVTYAPTYYGDTTDANASTPIALKGGEHIQAEIHLAPVTALHLIFHSSEKDESTGGFPTLERAGPDGSSLIQPGTGIHRVSSELIELTGIAPGNYKATSPGSSPTEVEVINNGQDLSDRKGEPLSTLKVSVRLFGERKLPDQFFVVLRDAAGKTTHLQQQVVKGEANFTDIVPGKYNIFAGTFTKAYPVIRVSADGVATPGHQIAIGAGAAISASLLLTSGVVSVQGFAKRAGKGASGVMVVLVPKDPQSNRELFRRDQSDLDGSFNLQGVAPGTYNIIAIQDGWDMDWALPEVIAPYLTKAQTITIGTDSEKSIQLKEAVTVQLHPITNLGSAIATPR